MESSFRTAALHFMRNSAVVPGLCRCNVVPVFVPEEVGDACLAGDTWLNIRTSERRNTTFGALFLLDRQPLWADVDVDALGRLLVGLIEFVTEHGNRNHERADDEVEDIVASHCRTPKDACCDPIPDERWVKSG